MKSADLYDKESMILPKLPAYFLFAVMFWVGWMFWQVVEPFFMVLLFSSVVVTITYPIFAKLEELLKGRRRLAAFLTCLVVVFVVVIPITLFLLILAGQAVDLYKVVSSYIQHFNVDGFLKWQAGNFFYDLSGPYSQDVASAVQNNLEALKTGLTDWAKVISSFAAKQSAMVLTELGISLFNLLLMFFTLYFLYIDGKVLLKKLMILSPLPLKYEKELFEKFHQMSKVTIFGTFLTAVAQGLVAWIGFSIAGVPSAFFWGTAVSICSLVPSIGTGLVWLPMGAIMLLGGNIWGLFILIWGVGLIATVDNFLRVIFIGSSANLNPLLTFISVFGGILAFGLIGVILGPMLLVIFLTLLHFYELEYADKLGKADQIKL